MLFACSGAKDQRGARPTVRGDASRENAVRRPEGDGRRHGERARARATESAGTRRCVKNFGDGIESHPDVVTGIKRELLVVSGPAKDYLGSSPPSNPLIFHTTHFYPCRHGERTRV